MYCRNSLMLVEEFMHPKENLHKDPAQNKELGPTNIQMYLQIDKSIHFSFFKIIFQLF
jgi:hypothetical protein